MKKVRKHITAIVTFIVILTLVAPIYAGAVRVGDSDISSRGAIVMDFETGIVLFGHNQDTLMVPASMIKMVTAYVIYDAIKADEISMGTVTRITRKTSEFSHNRTYSNVPLLEGARVTIRELMEMVIIRSACAATVALAEALCGNEEAFVKRMNEKATSLGIQARFFDSWGGSPDNRISPYGMAEISRALIRDFPEVLNITKKASLTYNDVRYNNSNLLLGEYRGLDGFKTGYTDPAGYCFIGTAQRGTRRMVTVVMGASMQARYPDTRVLLDYGFAVAEAMTAEQPSQTHGAVPSNANLILDGETMPLSAYVINDYHYFKLREIAFLLNGTERQFDVVWNDYYRSISLMGGVSYSSSGSDLGAAITGTRPYIPTPSSIFFNGELCSFESYLIDDLNYFKLRDISGLIGFEVNWDEATRTVMIKT